MEGVAFGGGGEVDGVDPIEVAIHKGTEEHGVGVFGDDVFAGDEIGQHRNRLSLMVGHFAGGGEV